MKAEKIPKEYSEETRIALLEQSINNINNTMIRFEQRFDKIDARFDKIDDKFDKIEEKIESNFRWLITIFGAGFVILLGAIHWL